jgi:hypothetical protein
MLPPVTGASTTVTLVCVLRLPSGSVSVDKMVEEEGAKVTTWEDASTVVSPPLEPGESDTEKTTRPLEVATGVAEGGTETGTAAVEGSLVAVVREDSGWMIPSLVAGGELEDWVSDWMLDWMLDWVSDWVLDWVAD